MHSNPDINFEFQKTTTEKVEKIMNKINIKKATGCDGIPAKIVKHSRSVFVAVNRFNKFICRLKQAQVTPLYKKNDPLEKTNTDQLVFSLFYPSYTKKCWKYNFQISLTTLLIHICVRLGVAIDVRPPCLDFRRLERGP